MDQDTHHHARWRQAAAPELRGHRPSDRQTLAPEWRSPAFASRGGQEGGRAPLQEASSARGSAGLIRSIARRDVLAPKRLQRFSYFGGGPDLPWRMVGVPRPHLAAAPNPRRLLVLGLPASLR
jgi:hypothetical protein